MSDVYDFRKDDAPKRASYQLVCPVFLVGFMGAGKTSAARKLARTAGVTAIDMDTYLERRVGKKITAIFDEQGEEGFRGPHMFVIWGSKNLTFQGFTVKDCANYAFLFPLCEKIRISNVEMIAGHDGVHTQRCSDVVIDGCTFRTGDDSIAGSDNRNFTVRNCRINSACNGLRFGCDGLLMEDCVFQGPGEFMHRLEGRLASLYAFDHFAPLDRKTYIPTDNWVIRRIKADRMLSLYRMDRNENWQEAQPAKSVTFEDVTVTNMQEPIRVFGRGSRDTALTLRRCNISTDPTLPPMPVLEMEDFASLTLEDTVLDNGGKAPLTVLNNGDVNIKNCPGL